MNKPSISEGQPPRKLTWWWILPVLWAALIFYFSTGSFTDTNTKLVLAQALALIHVRVSGSTLDLLDFLCRKMAHISNYAVLAVFLYYGFSGRAHPKWQPKRALACVLIAALYSLTDEFHQIFVPGRTPAFHDCAIDTAGALFGLAILYLNFRLFGTKQRDNERVARAT